MSRQKITLEDNGNIHGLNPLFLIDTITRTRIFDSTYWKEKCFPLNAETLIDEAIRLNHIGGTFGITILSFILRLILLLILLLLLLILLLLLLKLQCIILQCIILLI